MNGALEPVMHAIGLQPATTEYADAMAILAAVPEDDADLLRASARATAAAFAGTYGNPVPGESDATVDAQPAPAWVGRHRDPVVFGPHRW